jgi:hypothetical protein
MSSRAERSARSAWAADAVSGTSSRPASSIACAASTSGIGPASVRSTHQPRPSWRTVVTEPIQRCLTAASQRATSTLGCSSG